MMYLVGLGCMISEVLQCFTPGPEPISSKNLGNWANKSNMVAHMNIRSPNAMLLGRICPHTYPSILSTAFSDEFTWAYSKVETVACILGIAQSPRLRGVYSYIHLPMFKTQLETSGITRCAGACFVLGFCLLCCHFKVLTAFKVHMSLRFCSNPV